ncbi:methionyl-tRNA formyltransferase, partial [Candidatus Peregrinibacteria bacterium CG11_big_fil_rev_8_21_14_0_20_46_8]
MRKIKVIFIGTGSLGCPILHSLINDGRVELPFIITGQDKPQGRKMQMQANEIKKLALLNNLIVHQPVKSISELNNKIVQASPDFLLLTAFGQLIPSSTLALPKIAPVNIHWSLLPK